MASTIFSHTSSIIADKIELGKGFKVGHNVRIKVRGLFRIGDFSRIGDNVEINAEEVTIGDHFFHYTSGLRVGGGGSQFTDAVLHVGNRCVLHNNYLNLARAITLGNDVGLSPDVDIITHGFWQSVLEGYPTNYASVAVEDGVIVGQRSLLLPGSHIRKNIVVGAQSVVSGILDKEKSVYGGNPAKFISPIITPTQGRKEELFTILMLDYCGLSETPSSWVYPEVRVKEVTINVETKTLVGHEDEDTDKFRDFLRRYGIRIYTERPFLSL
jgi:acetyltransferase-like isoleucine patch superfamily enzyme